MSVAEKDTFQTIKYDRNVKSLNVCHFERSEKSLAGNLLKL